MSDDSFVGCQLSKLAIGLCTLLLVGCGGDDAVPTVNLLGDGTPVQRTDSRPNVIFIFTDDQGFADVGANKAVSDIKTPHIDRLAASGVRMTNGYATAPQCTPSRAGLMSGRYQQKFGVDDNRYTPFPLSQSTIAERLVDAGYKTGIVGKWHLELNTNSSSWFNETYSPGSNASYNFANIPASERVKYFPENRGFQDTFFGTANNYRANFDLDANTIEATTIRNTRFRVDVATDAAQAFIKRHQKDPFFLYVPYFAPHVPLEATAKHLSKFPGNMPERRRYALAMMSAVDEGVGRIVESIKSYGLENDTIIFFMSDNGAPMGMTMDDVLPVSNAAGVWNGSVNTPWVGEKGMLTEGAIRVPYIVSWKGTLPAGLVFDEPVMTLDASATALTVANADTSNIDGVNLIPALTGNQSQMNRDIYWRFWNQAAIRNGKWKYIQAAENKEYLFDLSTDAHETKNLMSQNLLLATSMKNRLTNWSQSLQRPGSTFTALNRQEKLWYNFYFNNDGS